MDFAVIVSKDDPAGMNIAGFLEGKLPQGMRLHFIGGNQCFADSVDEIKADFFVFASKHRAASGRPSLTCHAVGNWGKAEAGGREKTLVKTSSFLLRNYLLELNRLKAEKNLPFDATMECSHHGPFLRKPCVFIEVGSSEPQWNDKAACAAVAEAVSKATSLKCAGDIAPVIGVGGTHYCSEFSKLVLRKNFAFSHVCPEHALQFLDDALLQQAVACSLESPRMIVVDWKGLGKEKARVMDLLSRQGLPVERVQRLLR